MATDIDKRTKLDLASIERCIEVLQTSRIPEHGWFCTKQGWFAYDEHGVVGP